MTNADLIATEPARAARQIWQAGVDAVGGAESVRVGLDADSIARPDRILAVGKAAWPMCVAAMDVFPGVPALAVTKTGHAGTPRAGLEVIEAGHPVPDARSLAGGEALFAAVTGMGAHERLLMLVSGGASALAARLVDGVDLEGLTRATKQMLAQGWDITAINQRRVAMSTIKGGKLLAAFKGAAVTVLAISDARGDAIGVIGSGIGAVPDGVNYTHTTRIVATNAAARAAAVAKARALGFAVLRDEETVYGDVMREAERIGALLSDTRPGVHIFGGEPTVVLPENPGRGGRNQALALALSRHIAGRDDIAICVGGTDGSDGPTDAAGGLVDGSIWGAGAEEALERADSGRYLDAHGALLVTGPTGTNVMDVIVAVVGG